MTFLTGNHTSSAIRDIFTDADRIRMAVAFWGEGALKMLGGLTDSPEGVQILCNLDSGACNPTEIKRLLSVAEVRSHPKLHAKVYWTPQAMILGSSNASTNGLWEEAGHARGWREANLLINDPAQLTAAANWFDQLWAESYTVTMAHIVAARPLWAAGVSRAPAGQPLALTLFEAFRSAPEHPIWNRVKVAVTTLDLSAEGRKEYEAEVSSAEALADAAVYEDWNDRFSPDDLVIDIDAIGKRKPKISLFKAGSRLTQSATLTYLWSVGWVDVPPFGHFRLTAAEKKTLAALVPIVMQPKAAKEAGGGLMLLKDAILLLNR